VRGPHTEAGADEPDAPRERRQLEPRGLERVTRPGRGGVRTLWLGWIRNQPLLAAALFGFCVVAVVGLLLSLPSGLLPAGRTAHPPRSATVPTPAVPSESPASRIPSEPFAAEPSTQPGSWIEEAPSSLSARGLALVYRHRLLPPGGESRDEWIVQVRGPRPVLDAVDVVTWTMEPAAKNDGDLTSRNRAADGFPLFGDGPGGWFGVSAKIRFRDGTEETLSRRIELPD
jgi:hypothetical protein